MNSRVNGSRRSASDRGSTFVEALLALALFACACTTVPAGARSAFAAFRTVHRLVRSDRRLIRADTLLRRSISRIAVPPRAARFPVSKRGDGLGIAYLDGDPRRFLELSFRDGELIVADRFGDERVGPFVSVSFSVSPCTGDKRATAGRPLIYARIEEVGGEVVFVRAQTATWPIVFRPGGSFGGR